MHGFVCGTVKISSAFISKALVRPKLWKNLATRWSTSRIWTTLEPTTWTWTKPEMKLGVLQKITAGSACTNTHTHRYISSFVHTRARTRTHPELPTWLIHSLFLLLFIPHLIRFPPGKPVLTCLMRSDLADWLVGCLVFGFLAFVNRLPDGLAGCWQAG